MRLKFIACKYTLFIQDRKSYEYFFVYKIVTTPFCSTTVTLRSVTATYLQHHCNTRAALLQHICSIAATPLQNLAIIHALFR
jgi:hypothetical protein